MDNKKIKVAYYDCVDGRVPRKLKESIELVNLAVHDIEESGEYEVKYFIWDGFTNLTPLGCFDADAVMPTLVCD